MSDTLDRLLDLAVAIQQVPAPTFYESKRAAFVRDRFLAEALADVEMDRIGNVYARLPGKNAVSPLIISAHLDTVFPAAVDLKIFREPGRICGPGIGDNSLGVAGLFGLVWEFRQRKMVPPVDLWLVANVCEEGLGDLLGIKAVVERFGRSPRAYLVLEGMALGQVFHRALGVRRYRLIVRTPGGHSWIDHGKPSAIHVLTALATRVMEIPLPSNPRTTLNIGTISGGTSVNTIAAEAMLELDLRSEDGNVLASIGRQVEKLADGAQVDGVRVTAEVIGQRPAGELSSDHPLVASAQRCLLELGLEPHLNIGSTDANLPLSLGLPAVTIGLTTGRGGHTMQEYINTEPLGKGLEQVVRLIASLG